MLPHHFPINYIRPTPFVFKASQRNRNVEYHIGKIIYHQWTLEGPRGRDALVVGFPTTCAFSAYHHYSCELKSHS